MFDSKLANVRRHPASYKGCEKYKELQQKMRSRRQDITQIHSNYTPNKTSNNLSFADVIKNNNIKNQNCFNSIHNTLEQLNQSIQNISSQIVNLNKQLHLQVARIDTILSILDIMETIKKHLNIIEINVKSIIKLSRRYDLSCF